MDNISYYSNQDAVAITNGTMDTTSTDLNVTIDDLNYKAKIKLLPVLLFYVLVMVVGIVGNVFVLVVYKLKFKRSSARVYILCLALLDLSVCIVGIPYHALDLTMILTYTMKNTCKILSFLIGSCTLSSVFVLLVVGLDRFFKVCRPLKKQIVDIVGDSRACIIAVVIAIIISIPNFIFYGSSTVDTDVPGLKGVECFIDDIYTNSDTAIAYFGFNLLVFLMSVIFLVVIYGFICRKIIQHDKLKGAITINKRTGLCNCRSPDTDSINSDYIEEDNDVMVEMTTVIDYQNTKISKNTPTMSVERGSYETGNATNEDSKDINARTRDLGEHDYTPVKNNTDANHDSDLAKQEHVSKTDKHKLLTDKGRTTKNETGTEHVDSRKKSTHVKRKKNDVKKPHKKLQHVSSGTMIRHVPTGSPAKEKTTRKITLMMLTITVVFIICYLPFIVISILDTIDKDFWKDMGDFESIFNDIMLRLYLVNNMANPIIYGFWDKKFRRECVALIRRLCFRSSINLQRNTRANTKKTEFTSA